MATVEWFDLWILPIPLKCWTIKEGVNMTLDSILNVVRDAVYQLCVFSFLLRMHSKLEQPFDRAPAGWGAWAGIGKRPEFFRS
jgi:hypothetical protein